MGASDTIKKILVDKKLKVKDLAELMNIKPQSLSNKLNRDTFSFNEYCNICDLLGCEVVTKVNGLNIEYKTIVKKEEQ